MLLLTRRIGETVIIGDNEINVTILGIKGNQVRLGFNASKEIAIHRNEIYNRIQLEVIGISKDQRTDFIQ